MSENDYLHTNILSTHTYAITRGHALGGGTGTGTTKIIRGDGLNILTQDNIITCDVTPSLQANGFAHERNNNIHTHTSVRESHSNKLSDNGKSAQDKGYAQK